MYTVPRRLLPCEQCSGHHYYPESSAPFATDLCGLCLLNSGSVAGSYGIVSCVCSLGIMLVGAECQQCSAGYYCENQHLQTLYPVFSTSAAGSSQTSDCKCNTGYFFNTTSAVCQIWKVNSYCTGDQLMTDYKSSLSTLGLPGNTEEAACV